MMTSGDFGLPAISISIPAAVAGAGEAGIGGEC
jgi:hypothetical protein